MVKLLFRQTTCEPKCRAYGVFDPMDGMLCGYVINVAGRLSAGARPMWLAERPDGERWIEWFYQRQTAGEFLHTAAKTAVLAAAR